MTSFTPLRVRSHGSLLCGTAAPEALIRRALERGYDALALTDRDNLYLAIAFYRAARAEGLRPLLGAELTHGDHAALLLPLDRRGYAHLCALLTRRHLDPAFEPVAALAELHAGLHVVVESPGLAAALLRAGVPPAVGAASDGARSARGGSARPGGLWMGVRGLSLERPRLRERAIAARQLGVPLVATGDCALLEPRDHEAHRIAVTAAAGELLERMPPSAFCAREAWLAAPAEWERRVRITCAAAGLPQAAEEALANNRVLAARCRLELELGVPIFPRAPLRTPGESRSQNGAGPGETGPGYLLRLGREGIRRRYGHDDARALARLRDELGMIERMGFTDYFLLVAEIVEFARTHGIPTVGRGSGAGSIVAYALGITNVDPLRYGLYFERFLNPARRDCPDLDIDLCWRRRDEVIAHVYRTYGEQNVAMISTHATLGARSAFRETAKALGVSNARVNALAGRVPREMEPPYLERLQSFPESRALDWRQPPLPEALRLAERLAGAPRHLSIHCGGIVIADRPLTYYVPLQRAAKDVVVTQFEMRAIEAIGLVKMDLLGNRALTTIGECVTLARGRGADVDVERLTQPDPGADVSVEPLSQPDPPAVEALASGDTLNCFQLESPAMRHLLRMLDARTLDDTIAAVALVRPGPAAAPAGAGPSMKEIFCRRHRGLEPACFLHPRLEPVLGGTHGVMLYEEDVMCVAAALAGLSLAEGDDLRRAISAARTDQEFRALEHGFVQQATRTGIEPETARAAWRELTRFAAYAFCKAHAAGYGTLGWQSVQLKTRFPTEWAVGILNHHAGMYPTWVHVEDLRRRGVTFLAPCVNRSAWDSTLEPAPCGAPGDLSRARSERHTAGCGAPGDLSRARSAPHPTPPRSSSTRSAILAARVSGRPRERSPGAPQAAVRIGLGRVCGLSQITGQRVRAAREERPFRSLADLVDRARPSIDELQALILAGALDWTGRTRPALLLEARVGAARLAGSGAAGARVAERRARARPREPALVAPDGSAVLPDPVAPLSVPELPEFDLAERVRGEIQATGLWFSAHPLDLFIAPATGHGAVPAASLPGLTGRRVAIVGMPCAHRRVETRGGGLMLFTTLADASGLAECVLFPDAYRAFARDVRGQVVRIEGRVDETLGAVTLTAERVIALA